MKDSFQSAVPRTVRQSRLYVVDHGKLLEKPDILKGSCDSRPVYLDGTFSGDIRSVQKDLPFVRLVDTGQEIEDGCFSGSVGTDQPIKLALFYGNMEIVNGL